MAVTETKTVRDMVTHALRKAQITAYDETPTAEDADAALEDLNLMLKGWQLEPGLLWLVSSQSLALTTAASYDLSPVRPLRILSARLKRNGIEIPMVRLTRDEYDELPRKDTTGLPTQFYYDRQREAAKFYVWPVLATAAGETVQITYEREFEDVTDLDDTLDVPGEWWEATLYNLAARLAESYMMTGAYQMLTPRAVQTLDMALAQEREGSVFFAGPYAD